MATQLNDEQRQALEAINDWLYRKDSGHFFVLSGAAGTGKTYCIRELVSLTRGRFIFTAPTNKATKVLRESVTTDEYKPECRTIFSLLGLRLEPSGEVKELKEPDDPVDLSQYKAVIVDEGSMVSEQLFKYIQMTADKFGIKFLFLGDAAQLPPVGEARSGIWALTTGAALVKVMRHDNQILELATRLRQQVDRVAPQIQLSANNKDGEGIWRVSSQPLFEAAIERATEQGQFSSGSGSKVIAWRNVEVDRFNKLIRAKLFDKPDAMWLPSDRVLFTAPASDLNDDPMASTDDEGEIDRISEDWSHKYPEVKILRISITLDDNRTVIARVVHPASQQAFARRLLELSEARNWKEFWNMKDEFHSIRHAYAITAHRAQGSTYDTAFVYWQDVLLNRNRQEAYRCLYVACTRPKRRLILS